MLLEPTLSNKLDQKGQSNREKEGNLSWWRADLEAFYLPRELVTCIHLLTGGESQKEWGFGWRNHTRSHEESQKRAAKREWTKEEVTTVAILKLRENIKEEYYFPTTTPLSSPLPISPRPISAYPSPPDASNFSHIYWTSSHTLNAGEPLVMIGSPFGIYAPSAFLNCLSSGILSNKIQVDQRLHKTNISSMFPLLLTDVRCMPGYEGGPVIDQRGQLVGVHYFPFVQVLERRK